MYNFIIGSYLFIIVNLLIVSVLLLFRKQNSVSNSILAVYILMHVVIFIMNTCLFTNLIQPEMYIYTVLPSAMIGPLVYLFSQSIVNEKSKILRVQHLLHTVPALLYFILLKYDSLVFIGLSKASIDPDFVIGRGNYPAYMNIVIYFQLPVYKVISLYSYHKNVKNIDIVKNKISHKIQHGWSFLIGTSVFLAIYYLYRIFSTTNDYLNISDSIVSPYILLCMFVFIIISAMKTSSIYNETTSVHPDDFDERNVFEIDPKVSAQIDEKIKEYIYEKKIYKNPTLNLKTMSDIIEISPRLLSQYINHKYQKNFNDYINGFRVEEAKILLLKSEYEHLKLDAIGEKAGFSSRASFFSNFKKYTNETPSSFKKNALKEV